MRKTLFLLIMLICAGHAAMAQTVTIKLKKVVHNRPKPISDYKKTFVVNRPIIKAKTPALSKKIEAAVSYEAISDLKIKDELSEYQWLYEASYEVDYNKNGILSMTLLLEGSAAYPSSIVRRVVINTETGARITPLLVFNNLNKLAAKCSQAQQAEMQKALAANKKDPELADFNANEYFQNTKFTVGNLKEFSVDDRGVTFYYDYSFPHVIQSQQPDGTYFFAWSELKPFVKQNSVFARFVK